MPKYTMPEFLLTVDPGKATGLALFQVDQGDNVTQVWSKETDFMETCNEVNKVCRAYGPRLRIVCESFVITPQTGKNSAAPFSLEVIGVIKYFTEAFRVESLVFQTPQKAKNFCPNPRLKAVGFWHRGGDHARDALRHGVTHLVDCGWKSEKLLEN